MQLAEVFPRSKMAILPFVPQLCGCTVVFSEKRKGGAGDSLPQITHQSRMATSKGRWGYGAGFTTW